MELSKKEVINRIINIGEYQFERLVADLWELRGWDTTVTASSNDGGIDVIAEQSDPFHQKQLIQAKKYSRGNNVGSPDIQQYSSLKQQANNVDAIIVVTTSDFTTQAKDTAKQLNVKLIDGDRLYDILLGTEGEKIVDKYLTVPQEDEKVTREAADSSTDETVIPAKDSLDEYTKLNEIEESGLCSSMADFQSYLQKFGNQSTIIRISQEVFHILGYNIENPGSQGEHFDYYITKSNTKHHSPDSKTYIKVIYGKEICENKINTLNEKVGNHSIHSCLVFLINSSFTKPAELTDIAEDMRFIKNNEFQKIIDGAIGNNIDNSQSLEAAGKRPHRDYKYLIERIANKYEEMINLSKKGNNPFLEIVFPYNGSIDNYLQLLPNNMYNLTRIVTDEEVGSAKSVADKYNLSVLREGRTEVGYAVALEGNGNVNINSEMVAEIAFHFLIEVYGINHYELKEIRLIEN